MKRVTQLLEHLRRVSTLLEGDGPEYWHILQNEDGTWEAMLSISPDWGMGGQVFKSGFSTDRLAKEWVVMTFPKGSAIFSVFSRDDQERLGQMWMGQDPQFAYARKPRREGISASDLPDLRGVRQGKGYTLRWGDPNSDEWSEKVGMTRAEVEKLAREYADDPHLEVGVLDEVGKWKDVTGEFKSKHEDEDLDTLNDKLSDVQHEIDGFYRARKQSDPRYLELKKQERNLKASIRRKEATTEAVGRGVTREQIQKAIGRTWFDVEDQGDFWAVTSREHGDVGAGTPGDEDLKEGHRIHDILLKAFPGVKVEYSPVDEWVSIDVDKTSTGWQPTKRAEIPLSGGEQRKSGILTHDVAVQDQYRFDKTYTAKAGTRAEIGITNGKLTLYWHDDSDRVLGGFITQGAETDGDFFVPKQGRLERVKKAAFIWLPAKEIEDNGYEARPGIHDIGRRDTPNYEIVDRATGRVHYWAKGDTAWGQPRKYMVLRDVSDEAPEPRHH